MLFKVLQQMVHHPLTDKGIVQFKADWEKARQAAGAGVLAEGRPPSYRFDVGVRRTMSRTAPTIRGTSR